MAFDPKKQAYNASINAVTLGTGEKSVVVGGENVAVRSTPLTRRSSTARRSLWKSWIAAPRR